MVEEKDQTEDQAGTPEFVPFSEYEALKKAQAGSDRAYQDTKRKLDELTEQFKDIQNRSLSDKERAEMDLKEREETIAKKEQEVADATLRFKKAKVLAEKGLVADWEYWEKITNAQSEEEMEEAVAALIERQPDEQRGLVVSKPPRSSDRRTKKSANDLLREEYFRVKRGKR